MHTLLFLFDFKLAVTSILKGIVSDSNNIFLWHESEGINKKLKFKIQKFKITFNFNGSKLARNREVAKFGCQNGQKCLQT